MAGRGSVLLSHTSRVLAEIARACASGEAIKPSTVAAAIASSNDAVRAAIQSLRKQSYIRSERRGNQLRYEHLATGAKSAWIEWSSRMPRQGAGRPREAAVTWIGPYPKTRKCITCEEPFRAEHKFNRMCKLCRRNASAVIDDYWTVRPGSSRRAAAL